MSNIWYAPLILLLGIIAAGCAHIVLKKLREKVERTASKFDDIIIISIEKPLIITIVVVSIWYALEAAVRATDLLGPGFASYLDDAHFTALFILIGAWIVSTFVHNLVDSYGSYIAAKIDPEFNEEILRTLKNSSKYIIWFIAVLMVLQTLKIEITPLLAGAGIAGIAIALAAKDILSNFFGGALIMVDKPFRINDRIKIGDFLGDVVSIGPRSTRIKTLDYQLLTIPNSTIANSVIVNYAEPDVKLKIKIPVSVAYGSDVHRVKEILLEIAGEAAKHSEYILTDPKPSVYFLEFADSSLDFMLVLWAKAFNLAWEVKDFINTRIDERFNQEGIEIPFPQVDVHQR